MPRVGVPEGTRADAAVCMHQTLAAILHPIHPVQDLFRVHYALHNVSYAKQQVSCFQTVHTASHADENMPDVKASHTALQGAGPARIT